MAMNSTEIQKVLAKALVSDAPLLKRALDYDRRFREETAAELATLIKSLNLPNQDFEALRTRVLNKLTVDGEIVGKLNESLVALNPVFYGPQYQYKETECTFPLKFNKMALAIAGAKTFVESHLTADFCSGIMPEGYDFKFNPNAVTVLGNFDNSPNIFGNSKATFLKTASLTTHLVCHAKHQLQNALTSYPYFENGCSWIDSSVMTHLTFLPNHICLQKLDPRFEQFTYSFYDPKTPNGFVFVHSGYAFGGHRSEGNRYPNGKYLGPEDCSSFAAKITGSKCHYTTPDQLYFYRQKLHEGFVDQNWLKGSPEFSALEAICEPVLVKDPTRDIQAGQIYCHRQFNIEKDPTLLETLGTSGHTGIVIGFEGQGPDSKVLIMGANRDMPNKEGVGIEAMPYVKEGRKIMVFSSKAKNAVGVEELAQTALSAPEKRVAVRFKI